MNESTSRTRRSRSKRTSLLQAEVERITNDSNKGAFKRVGSAIGTVAHAAEEVAHTVVKTAQTVNLGLAGLQQEIIDGLEESR